MDDHTLRSLQARVAAHRLHAQRDSRELTSAARAGFERRFLIEVDPAGLLPEPERLRRAAQARAAYFAELALQSAKARRRRAAARAPWRYAEKGADSTESRRQGPPLVNS